MSTATTTVRPTTGVRLPSRLPAAGEEAVPFTRLVHLELRKMVDTRAGRWLLIVIGLLTAVVIGIALFTGSPDKGKDFGDFIAASVTPQAVLLPVLGILAVTTEWSQRTGLVTFTLEPRRHRVGLAKCAAAALIGIGAVLVGLVIAAAATVAGALLIDSNPSWQLKAAPFFGMFLAQLLGIAMGLAFGMLLRNTPAAIVAYFMLPTLWSVASSVGFMRTAGHWLDTNRTISPLFEGSMTTTQWAQFGVSALVWAVIPLIAGMWLMNRSEVKSS